MESECRSDHWFGCCFMEMYFWKNVAAVLFSAVGNTEPLVLKASYPDGLW